MIRGLIKRYSSRTSSAAASGAVRSDLLDTLCDKMDTLSLEGAAPFPDVTLYREKPSRVIISKRFYSTYRKNNQDTDHLNCRGRIKSQIIERRLAFIKNKGLLEDRRLYLGRLIYENHQLYPVDAADELGRLNLKRMASGNCPYSFKKDYVIIHHLDQTHDGPWVILPQIFHQYYHEELHSQISLEDGVIRTKFSREKNQYWKQRAAQLTLDSLDDEPLEDQSTSPKNRM